MADVHLKGTTFVLTGAMWDKRAKITEQINDAGGYVAPAVRGRDQVLVVASNRLQRERDGKWTVLPGQATTKVHAAIEMGVLVLHEAQLQHALLHRERVVRPGSGPIPGTAHRASSLPTAAATAPPPMRNEPQWSDELRKRMDETSKLLEGF